MKITSSTDILIENLLDATYGDAADARQKFIFREALRNLVRLAKAEQVHEMRTTVGKLIGGAFVATARQRTKTRQRPQAQAGRCPQQMEFNQFD